MIQLLSFVHTVPVFSPGVATVWSLGPHRSDNGKHHIGSGYTVLNRRSPESVPGGFKNWNHRDSPGRTGLQNNAGLFHLRSSSGMNSISSVRPPRHTVAPPGLHRECTVANRSITGTDLGGAWITFCPKPVLVRSTAGNVWTHSNSFTFRPSLTRSTGYKLPGRTRAYTGTVWTRL